MAGRLQCLSGLRPNLVIWQTDGWCHLSEDTARNEELQRSLETIRGPGSGRESLMQAHTTIETTDPTLRRICAEYLEMPGLCLTLDQARRLWGLDEATCVASLRQLIDARFLMETDAHMFARFTEEAEAPPRWQMAKAGLQHAARRKTRHANVG